MLSVAALSAQDLQMPALALFSPSKHPFMKRVQKSRFSFDPYKLVLANQKVALPILSAVPPALAEPTEAPQVISVAAPESLVKKTTVTSSTVRYALVSFKQGSALLRAPFRIVAGDLVVVEGDRGEHIGTVKSITTEQPAETITAKIIRRASSADREAFQSKVEKEQVAKSEITKIATEVRLNATVVDVEYQFDMNKLTIFVERATATTFVDFRKLQRTLFRQFHCRIWCAYMDEIKA